MVDYDAFATVYDDFFPHTEDVAFYASLAAEARGPVVELAVGTGRVAIPIVQQTGRRLIGIDLSPAMVEVARSKASAAGVDLDLRVGDMRELELAEPTDLVICPARAMLHLSNHDERVEAMRRVARVLDTGGRFAWNAFVFVPTIAAEIDGIWREQGGVRHRSTYDFTERRIDLELESGGSVPLWWVEREEWEDAISESGLDLEALYGWFDRRPFDDESREFVYVARKP